MLNVSRSIYAKGISNIRIFLAIYLSENLRNKETFL